MEPILRRISANIDHLESLIKLYDSTKDIRLSESLELIRPHLSLIPRILETCKGNLETRIASILEDDYRTSKPTLEFCCMKAGSLNEALQKLVPSQSDSMPQQNWGIRREFTEVYKVDHLMLSIAENIRRLVKHHGIKLSDQSQHAELEAIIDEMKSVISGSDGDDIRDGQQYNTKTPNFGKTHLLQLSSRHFRIFDRLCN